MAFYHVRDGRAAEGQPSGKLGFFVEKDVLSMEKRRDDIKGFILFWNFKKKVFKAVPLLESNFVNGEIV